MKARKKIVIELNSEKNFKKAEWYKSRGYSVMPYGFNSVIIFK